MSTVGPDRLEPGQDQRVREIARHARRRAGQVPQRKAVFRHELGVIVLHVARIMRCDQCSWSLFLLAWFIFTFGPGIAITGRLTRDLDPLRRIVIALGAGTAAAPSSSTCSAAWAWCRRFRTWPLRSAVSDSGCRADRRAPPAAAVTASRARHRPHRGAISPRARRSSRSRPDSAPSCSPIGSTSTPAGIVLYGDYDTADLHVLRGRGVRSVAHGPADGVVLLRPQAQRRVLPASRPRDDPSVRERPGAVDVFRLRVADVSRAQRADRLRARAVARLARRRGARRRARARRQRFLVSGGLVSAGRAELRRVGLRPLADELPVADDAGPALQHVGPVAAAVLHGAVRDRARTADARARLDRAQRVSPRDPLRVQAVRLRRPDGRARRGRGLFRPRPPGALAFRRHRRARRRLHDPVSVRGRSRSLRRIAGRGW